MVSVGFDLLALAVRFGFLVLLFGFFLAIATSSALLQSLQELNRPIHKRTLHPPTRTCLDRHTHAAASSPRRNGSGSVHHRASWFHLPRRRWPYLVASPTGGRRRASKSERRRKLGSIRPYWNSNADGKWRWARCRLGLSGYRPRPGQPEK